MLRGLLHLTWLETKIFVREPLGVFGTVGVPVLTFVAFGGLMSAQARGSARGVPRAISADLPVLAALLITATTVLSLVSIIAIYREGGILRRLRATPLRPSTILTAHVLVKLVFTAITFAVMLMAGRRYGVTGMDVPLMSFGVALLFSTLSLLSLGFLVASVVPTARFAQPVGTLLLYPMLALSGLFFPIAAFPPLLRAVARALPLTYAVSLLRGIWHGEGWAAHWSDAAMLVLMALILTALSSRVFRWE